jgi:hypothetical protein
MSEKGTIEEVGNTAGILLDANENIIAPPVDEDIKAEVEKALSDVFVRKLIVTIITSYQTYALARDLMQTETGYSDATIKGVMGAVWNDLVDTNTGQPRGIDFKQTCKRLRDQVMPFTRVIQKKLDERIERAREEAKEHDAERKAQPVPFFGPIEKLERGEIYIVQVPEADKVYALKALSLRLAETGQGVLWLSGQEDVDELLRSVGNDISIAPKKGAYNALSNKLSDLMDVPLLDAYIVDDVTTAFGTGRIDYAAERLKESLESQKRIAIITVTEKSEWWREEHPPHHGKLVKATAHAGAGTAIEDLLTVEEDNE